jgi:hypothetical protein
MKKYLFPGPAACLIAVFFALMLAGCGPGLPDKVKQDALDLQAQIRAARAVTADQKKKYENLVKSPGFSPVKKFAQRENWAEKFSLAQAELDRAQSVYDKELAPLIKENRPQLAPEVIKRTDRIKKIIINARNMARYPAARFSKLAQAIVNADNIQTEAKSAAAEIMKIVDRLRTGPVEKAMNDFPDIRNKISAKFAPMTELARQTGQNLDTVIREYERHRSGSQADYAAFSDSADNIVAALKTATKLETIISKQISGLYRSYTKILKDMKIRYFIIVKRESWNENSDFYDPWDVSFQREVSPDVYEALTSPDIDTIATINAGFFGSSFSSSIGSLWNRLSIDPTEAWPGRGHNAASFWVDDAYEKYYHKYILEENGKTTETDWIQVDESVYNADLDFLGMAILAKPYGVFEKDRIVQPSPPGMAYVGNPKYGEWKKDDTGNRFWSWYGKYAFFSSLFFSRPHPYYYNSWNNWRHNYRNSRPYYGKDRNGARRFGTFGTFVRRSPRFQNSAFAKSGGFRTQPPSVRGAGPGLRGGGPGTRGK